MDRLFDSDLTEVELVDMLSEMEFRKIGEGSIAHVFGDTTMNIVVKIFPPLSIGNPEDLDFIDKNVFLRYADILTTRWQKYRPFKFIRKKAKSIVAFSQSKHCANISKRQKSSELCIKAYEISINRGLMKGLPTRIIPNCVSKLSINTKRKIMGYLVQPRKIVLQKRFKEKDVLINIVKSLAQKGDIIKCRKMLEDALNFQVYLWRHGLTNTDMSFNMIDSLILLPDAKLQLYDVNGINDSFKLSTWFIREKEKDMAQIFNKIGENKYPQFLFNTNRKGVLETARKLHRLFPKNNRDDLVLLFLNLSKEILSEKVMTQNWGKDI